MKAQCPIAQLLGGKKGAIGARLRRDPQDDSPWHLIPSQFAGMGFPIRNRALGQYCKYQVVPTSTITDEIYLLELQLPPFFSQTQGKRLNQASEFAP